MKKCCFNCHEEKFLPLVAEGEIFGRECINCGAQELYDDYYIDEEGAIKKFQED